MKTICMLLLMSICVYAPMVFADDSIITIGGNYALLKDSMQGDGIEQYNCIILDELAFEGKCMLTKAYKGIYSDGVFTKNRNLLGVQGIATGEEYDDIKTLLYSNSDFVSSIMTIATRDL